MSAMLLKLLSGLLFKLLTEGFFYKLLVRLAWQASQLSSNTLDDGVVEDIAKNLGVEDYK